MGFFSNVSDAIDTIDKASKLNRGTGLGDAPSGYGSEYDTLFAQNPYRNLTYNKSFWQEFVSSLGFRTDYDRWKEDAQVNANEYDAGIFSMMQQNDFNSPISQADRMRDAGLNPDLLGLGDVQAGAKPAEDPNGMSQNAGNSEFMDFAGNIASVFSRAMAIFKDFKSLDQMNTIIDSQNIDNAVKMTGAIDSFIESSLTAEDLVDFETYQDRIHDLSSRDYMSQFADHMGFSNRQVPQFRRLMHDRLLSIGSDEKVYSKFRDRILAMAGSKEAQANPFSFATSGNADVTNESAVDIMVRNMVKMSRKASKLNAERDAYLASVQNQEAQNLDLMNAGKASASAQVSEYNADKATNQWNAECARVKKDMIQQLERASLSGDMLAKAMLFSWSLDDIARLNVGLNAGLNLSFGANFGANLSNSVSTILKP